jgi:flagellar motor protein MotB
MDGNMNLMRRRFAVLLVPLWLAACESPYWLDPTEVFGGRTPEPQVIDSSQAEVPSGGAYPKLSSVPDTRPLPSPEKQRKRLVKGLSSDKDSASHSTDGVTAEATGQPPKVPPKAPSERPREGTAPYTTTVPPEPMPAPPGAEALRAPPAVTAPDVPAEAAPPPEPELASDPAGRMSLAEGTSRVRLRPRGELVGVVYFAEGSADLDAAGRRVLADVALLRKQRGGLLRVIGHDSLASQAPDPVEDRMAKFELSLERANTVAASLLDLGTGRKALEIVAASDSAPVYAETGPGGAAGNRRVEIFLAK